MKRACASRPKVKNKNALFATTGGFKCINCEKLGHRASECILCRRDKEKINSCYRCGKINNTCMQFEKRNRSLCGGLSAHEKACKVGRALPVKKLNTVKFDKPKEENLKR